MPREPGRDLRQEAERKVEQRFAQQREALFASHKEQRERDLRAQQQAVERVAQEQARIADKKREALEQHERKWDQMRDRIAYKPARAVAVRLDAAARSRPRTPGDAPPVARPARNHRTGI